MNVVSTRPSASSRALHGRQRYEALLDTLERRATARAFDAGQPIDADACQLILEAARLAPSGANAQPWHFIVVDVPATRAAVAGLLSPGHPGAASAPGCIVVITDFRLTWAYPGLMDGTELDQRYHATAERIILQSVAAATTAAHLAAAALGYQSWWISTLSQDALQAGLHALLEVPADLTITDIMLFGVAASPPLRRWKKQVNEIASWNRFDPALFRSLEQIDAFVRDRARRPVGLK